MRTRAVAPATVNAAIHRSLINASIQASSNICLCPPFPSTSPHSFKLEFILCVSLFFLQCQRCVQRLLSPITVQKYLWGKLSQIYLLALKQVCRQYLKKLRLIYLLSLRNKLPKIEKSNVGECLSYSNLDLGKSNWAEIGFANYLKYW